MSDSQNQNAQSHYAMEEQYAADMAPAVPGKPAKTFLMFSLIAFGAVGGYVNANWESYKDVLGFAAASQSDEKPCCASKRTAPPSSVLACCQDHSLAVSSDESTCPISGKATSCCSQKDELASATGGESPCCSQMNKAIVAAMLEVASKSEAAESASVPTSEVVVSSEPEAPAAPALPEEI